LRPPSNSHCNEYRTRHAVSDAKVEHLTSAIENAKREHSNELRSYLETAAEMALENEFLKVDCCRGGSMVVEWAFLVVFSRFSNARKMGTRKIEGMPFFRSQN
jgi:hypothetical protein